jgi:hypothetical protein
MSNGIQPPSSGMAATQQYLQASLSKRAAEAEGKIALQLISGATASSVTSPPVRPSAPSDGRGTRVNLVA